MTIGIQPEPKAREFGELMHFGPFHSKRQFTSFQTQTHGTRGEVGGGWGSLFTTWLRHICNYPGLTLKRWMCGTSMCFVFMLKSLSTVIAYVVDAQCTIKLWLEKALALLKHVSSPVYFVIRNTFALYALFCKWLLKNDNKLVDANY